MTPPVPPDPWQRVFRNGMAPQLPTAGLVALRDALASKDARLIHGATTMPPPLQCCEPLPVEACCPVCFAGWQGAGLRTVAEVIDFFARACFACDQALGEPAACRWFLNWIDSTPLDELRPALLVEVDRELARRRAAAA
jgi:hypothetical protein